MKRGINVIDLFSGIGGFSLGLQKAGFEIWEHYYSEIEKNAIANYKFNFKNAKYIGSVTDVRGGEFGRGEIDVITFGRHNLTIDYPYWGNRILSFQTVDICEDFLENFRDLIEQAKKLI